MVYSVRSDIFVGRCKAFVKMQERVATILQQDEVAEWAECSRQADAWKTRQGAPPGCTVALVPRHQGSRDRSFSVQDSDNLLNFTISFNPTLQMFQT